MSKDEFIAQIDNMIKKREDDSLKVNRMIDEKLRSIVEEILHGES